MTDALPLLAWLALMGVYAEACHRQLSMARAERQQAIRMRDEAEQTMLSVVARKAGEIQAAQAEAARMWNFVSDRAQEIANACRHIEEGDIRAARAVMDTWRLH